MIYKIQLDEFVYSEVEYEHQEKSISLHLAQGYYAGVGLEVQYTHFTNVLLSKENCEQLIKSLQLALNDSKL